MKPRISRKGRAILRNEFLANSLMRAFINKENELITGINGEIKTIKFIRTRLLKKESTK